MTLGLPLLPIQEEDFPKGVRTKKLCSKCSEYSKFLDISVFTFPFK